MSQIQTERFCWGQREDFPSSLTADNSCFCLINIRHSLFSALSQSVGAAAHTLSASSTSSHPTSAKLKARKHSAHTLTQSNDDDDDGGGEEVTQIHVDRSEAEMEKLRRKQKSGRLTHTYPRTCAHTRAHSFCLAAIRSKINASLSFFCSDGHKPRIAALRGLHLLLRTPSQSSQCPSSNLTLKTSVRLEECNVLTGNGNKDVCALMF